MNKAIQEHEKRHMPIYFYFSIISMFVGIMLCLISGLLANIHNPNATSFQSILSSFIIGVSFFITGLFFITLPIITKWYKSAYPVLNGSEPTTEE